MRLGRVTNTTVVFLLLAAIGCIAGGVYALHLGQDINYDQMNYHYDSAYELLHDRLTFDAAPEGLIHAYFNPLPYVPFYVMERHLPPLVVVFLLGAWGGANLGLVLVIAWRAAEGFTPSLRVPLCAGAMLAAVAAPMALSETGTTLSDITTSLFVLGGLVLMIEATAPGRNRRGALLTGFGSGLIGMAIGLKLTNSIYVPGVAACCVIGWRSWPARVRAVLAAGVGGACGLLLTGGFWFERLWSLFRSPFFPYYDAIFQSPAIDPQSPLHGTSFFDDRFLPDSLLNAVMLPFQWLSAGTSTAELPFRDIRFAIIECVLASALLLGVVGGAVRWGGRRFPPLSAAQGKLLFFFVASFVLWMAQFSIQRYLLALDLLAGPVLMVGLGFLLRGRLHAAVTLGVGLLALATVRPSDWPRIKPAASWYDVKLPAALEQPGLVFLQGPISFIVPFLPADSHVVGLEAMLRPGSGTLADRVTTAALSRAPGMPVFVLADEPVSLETRETLGAYGLQLSGPCWPVANRGTRVSACAFSRMAAPGPSATIVRPGQSIVFDADLHGLPIMLPRWHMESAWGLIGTYFDPALQLRLDPAFGSEAVQLTFQIAGIAALKPDATVVLLANDQLAAVWHPKQPAANGPFVGCIPAAAIGDDRVVTLRFRYPIEANHPAAGDRPAAIDAPIGLLSLVAEPVAACAAQAAAN